MVGQKELVEKLIKQIGSGTYPRFSIIVGPRGCGKKYLSKVIARELLDGSNEYVMAGDVRVDTIRKIIQQSYKTSAPVVYIIPDADNMSLAAKNALLKVTEEPPNHAYFIMTLQDVNQTLETIRSRGTVYNMEPYTPDQIEQYFTENYDSTAHEITAITNICETPGEVDILTECGIIDFYDYVNLVVDNIAETSGSNAFKIGNKLKFKDTDDGFDFQLFLKAFLSVTVQKWLQDRNPKYLLAGTPTSQAIQDLRIKGINKQAVFDQWMLSIRERWMS